MYWFSRTSGYARNYSSRRLQNLSYFLLGFLCQMETVGFIRTFWSKPFFPYKVRLKIQRDTFCFKCQMIKRIVPVKGLCIREIHAGSPHPNWNEETWHDSVHQKTEKKLSCWDIYPISFFMCGYFCNTLRMFGLTQTNPGYNFSILRVAELLTQDCMWFFACAGLKGVSLCLLYVLYFRCAEESRFKVHCTSPYKPHHSTNL